MLKSYKMLRLGRSLENFSRVKFLFETKFENDFLLFRRDVALTQAGTSRSIRS